LGPLDAWLVRLRQPAEMGTFASFGGYFANLIGMVVLMTKASILVCVQIWVRWTLPRLRIDQVMMTCLKYLVPISCFLFLGAVLWPLAMAAMTAPGEAGGTGGSPTSAAGGTGGSPTSADVRELSPTDNPPAPGTGGQATSGTQQTNGTPASREADNGPVEAPTPSAASDDAGTTPGGAP
ncbi:MAG: NADH-quinone oxidoreductase subunit H, partial [Planctomycetes bacterium]|nr:NADH-quinone oxidoreductase subunit H [Planctomycetota bacterium]